MVSSCCISHPCSLALPSLTNTQYDSNPGLALAPLFLHLHSLPTWSHLVKALNAFYMLKTPTRLLWPCPWFSCSHIQEFLGGVSNGIMIYMELLTSSSLWENKAKQINTLISSLLQFPSHDWVFTGAFSQEDTSACLAQQPKSHCSQAIMPFDGRVERKSTVAPYCAMLNFILIQDFNLSLVWPPATVYSHAELISFSVLQPSTFHCSSTPISPWGAHSLPNWVCLSQLRVTLLPSSLTMGRWLKYGQPIFHFLGNMTQVWAQIPDLWSYWKSKAAQLRECRWHLNPWMKIGPRLFLSLSVMEANKCSGFVFFI